MSEFQRRIAKAMEADRMTVEVEEWDRMKNEINVRKTKMVKFHHEILDLTRKLGESDGKFVKYKEEYKKIEEECVSLRDLNLEFGEMHDMQINRIEKLEALAKAADAIISPAMEILPDTYEKEIEAYYKLK
jgi:hypothetical protein